MVLPDILLQVPVSGADFAKFIFLEDYIALPFYLILIKSIFNKYANRYYPKGHPWRKYYKTGFYLKLVGAIMIGLVYQYYYSGGDTSAYFVHAKIINSSLFNEGPLFWFNLLTHNATVQEGGYSFYIGQMMWYDASEYFICSITAVLGLLGLNLFLPTSLLFACLAFGGGWSLFKTFAQQHPPLAKYIAVACLYLPSIVMWGSGIFKDTLCLAGLGWLTYSAMSIFILKKFTLRNWIILILSGMLIIKIKVYIMLAFAPALAVWVLFLNTAKIKNWFLRFIMNVGVSGLALVGLGYFTSVFAEELGQYSLENIAETSQVTREYLAFVSGTDKGSSYNLGDIDPTPAGMLKKFPAAVNVTLFRPYIWEARKPMVMLNALEVFVFLFLTIKVFLSVGIFKTIWTIIKDPNIQFFLIFTLVFAFAVGITSINFGALSRYRVPCLPFFMMMLIFIYYKNKPITRNFFAINFK